MFNSAELSKARGLQIEIVSSIVPRIFLSQENICDVREDRDLLSLNFAFPAAKRTRLDRARASDSPRAHLAGRAIFDGASIQK